jgi:DNA polymerase lambda
MELHKAKLGEEDRWRVYSYSKCMLHSHVVERSVLTLVGIRALRNYPKKIKSFNEARSINGVGEKTAQKVCTISNASKFFSQNTSLCQIKEIIETGNLRRIGYEKTDDVAAINLFQGIYGVGMERVYF